MKRKLIALAVASAFVAPAAMADVTIYGVANVSFDSTNTGSATGTTSQSQTKVSSTQSRIGFKGTEDVGGGNSAIWQIEQGVNMDSSANSSTPACTSTAVPAGGGTPAITCGATTANNGILGTRNTFVGLKGDSWGQVVLGTNDSPYKSSTRGMDVFADTIADNRTLLGTQSAISFESRFANSITYNNTIGAIKLGAQYVAGAEAATAAGTTKGNAWSLSGGYAEGPITAALAYEIHDFGSAGTGTLGATGAAAVNQKERAFKLAGGYAVDQFAVNLVFEKMSDDFSAAKIDHRAWYLGGKYNLSGNDAVKLAYTKMNDVGVGTTSNGAKQISIGYDHNMSKRTTVYALYTKLSNDTAANYTLGSVSTGAVGGSGPDADPSAVSIGIKHSF